MDDERKRGKAFFDLLLQRNSRNISVLIDIQINKDQ